MRMVTRRRLRSLLAAAVAGALAVVLVPAAPAAATSYQVDKRFFGMHDYDLTSWPAGSPGSVRLWDAGVTWRDIETSPGVYDFTRLDALVRAANSRGAEVTLVLGMTPDFYASAVPGVSSMPKDLGQAVAPPQAPVAWVNYVRALVTRYSPANWGGTRGIAAYQVWNEANVVNFWTGTPAQMAELTRSTWNTVKSLDRGALVVSPAYASRISEQIRGIKRFAFAWVKTSTGYVPAWRFTDAISLNLYPLDKYGTTLGTPEKSMALLAQVRKLLGYGGVPASKPIWNTEINYGMRSVGAVPISSQAQAAYVLRTYLLNAANGVTRVDWYAWDMGRLPNGTTLGNTRMTDPSTGQVTLAGRAFGLAKKWMLSGTLLGPSPSVRPCAKDQAGTYTCIIRYDGGFRRVYWNPTGRVTVVAAKGATYRVGVYGVRKAVKSRAEVTVDYRPVMVRSKF